MLDCFQKILFIASPPLVLHDKIPGIAISEPAIIVFLSQSNKLLAELLGQELLQCGLADAPEVGVKVVKITSVGLAYRAVSSSLPRTKKIHSNTGTTQTKTPRQMRGRPATGST